MSILAFGCSSAPKKTIPLEKNSVPIRSIVKGSWGIEKECNLGFGALYSFSEDGAKMFVKAPPGGLSVGGELREMITYQVLAENENTLRMVIENEERRTESGHVVVWDLVLINKDSFCWHREDWQPGSCTKILKQCDDDT
jgi:hypothetical protein